MNYRHAFHAGNFADVIKHAVLARIVVYLKEKPAAFRVIDTHAGAGLYDLSAEGASRTGEWRQGIGRLLAAELPADARILLAPYLDAVVSLNAGEPGGASGEPLKTYPGSPTLVRHLLRAQDRLIACEAEPVAARALAENSRGDNRVKAVAIDGYTALNAYVPPKERRGLVLIDPPFEQPDEFDRLANALVAAYRKWPTGLYGVWYPIKNVAATERFGRHLARSGLARMLRAEVTLTPTRAAQKLAGSGLILVNPPWTLEKELAVLLPALATILASSGSGTTRLDWLAPEK